jgi:hypothetical protein
MPAEDFIAALTNAVQGLNYPSESDTPFDVVQFGQTGDAHDQVMARATGRKVTVVPVREFFDQLVDSDDAERFSSLRETLEGLADFTIFRVGNGEVTVDIFLLGKEPASTWIGLHTQSVET